MANQAIRRARQHKHLGVTFTAIPIGKLTVVCHSDAAFANRGNHTQAGYVLGFTDQSLQSGQEAPWSPIAWRSFRLPRAVSSTLAAESRAMSVATGTVEWVLLLLAKSVMALSTFDPVEMRSKGARLSWSQIVKVCLIVCIHLHHQRPLTTDEQALML